MLHTDEGTKCVARPQASISTPSNLAPVRPTYSPAFCFPKGDGDVIVHILLDVYNIHTKESLYLLGSVFNPRVS